jgi:hypothetical protein
VVFFAVGVKCFSEGVVVHLKADGELEKFKIIHVQMFSPKPMPGSLVQPGAWD